MTAAPGTSRASTAPRVAAGSTAFRGDHRTRPAASDGTVVPSNAVGGKAGRAGVARPRARHSVASLAATIACGAGPAISAHVRSCPELPLAARKGARDRASPPVDARRAGPRITASDPEWPRRQEAPSHGLRDRLVVPASASVSRDGGAVRLRSDGHVHPRIGAWGDQTVRAATRTSDLATARATSPCHPSSPQGPRGYRVRCETFCQPRASSVAKRHARASEQELTRSASVLWAAARSTGAPIARAARSGS